MLPMVMCEIQSIPSNLGDVTKNSRPSVGNAARILPAPYGKVGEERDELKNESFHFQVKFIENIEDPELIGLKNLFPIPNLSKILKFRKGIRTKIKSSMELCDRLLRPQRDLSRCL